VVAGDIVLGANQYGKAECRLVRITRDIPDQPRRHEIEDLNVTSQLRGDFEAAHTDGDNAHVVATDTQKNTVYAFARKHGVHSPEQFLLTLGDHFVGEFPWVTGGRWAAEQYSWTRISTDGRPHDHSFVRTGGETRTAVVQRDGEETFVVSGLTGTITDVNVRLLGITTAGDNNNPPEHWVEDVDVMLSSPDGRESASGEVPSVSPPAPPAATNSLASATAPSTASPTSVPSASSPAAVAANRSPAPQGSP
jgi:hypothetical protein